MKAIVPLASCVLLLAACSQPAAPTTAVQVSAQSDLSVADGRIVPLEKAKAAASEFSNTLKQRLMADLQANGPAHSIGFCRDEAPKIARSIEQKHGVRLGRVPANGKLRNPSNAPSGWQQDVVDDFQSKFAQGQAANALVSVQRAGLPPGVALRFAKGIAVQPACLTCHGSEVAAPVRDAIHRHYPDDKATGLRVGDLRGALWVEVPADHEQDGK